MSVNPTVITDLHQGAVIAYPTEAVFGLGCDPDNQQAVMALLAIKQRPIEKGLILIAATYEQLLPYVDETQLTQQQKTQIQSSWPGGTTWVLPAAKSTGDWLTGDHISIAVRVSAHPVVQALCLAFGKPLVSTSANLSGQSSINDIDTLRDQIGDKVSHIVPGQPDTSLQPSTIIDALSGVVYRH